MDNLLLKILGFETGDDAMEQDAFGGFSPQQRIRELFLMKQRGSDKELQDRKKEMQHWAAENNLVSLLLQKADQEKDDEDVVRNIFSFLCEIIEKGVNPLSQKLYSTEVLEQLVDLIVKNVWVLKIFFATVFVYNFFSIKQVFILMVFHY